ncbi:MAG TPA: hypothetical protein EYO58_05910 [Flavobacteriales bacterium]|nr:hypothetical protein [Flavobacteriales bacterium]
MKLSYFPHLNSSFTLILSSHHLIPSILSYPILSSHHLIKLDPFIDSSDGKLVMNEMNDLQTHHLIRPARPRMMGRGSGTEIGRTLLNMCLIGRR